MRRGVLGACWSPFEWVRRRLAAAWIGLGPIGASMWTEAVFFGRRLETCDAIPRPRGDAPFATIADAGTDSRNRLIVGVAGMRGLAERCLPVSFERDRTGWCSVPMVHERPVHAGQAVIP